MLPGKTYTPQYFIDLAARNWKLLAASSACTLFLALLYSSTLPSRYESEALIQVIPQRVPEALVPTTVTMRIQDRVRAIRQQILSHTQLEELITTLSLYPERGNRPVSDSTVNRFQKDIKIDGIATDQSVEAFRVKFTYSDPLIAQQVAERLAMLFVEQNIRDRGAQAEATSSFLQSELEQARKRLLAQEAKLKEFRERNSGRLPTQMESNLSARQGLQMQLQASLEGTARARDQKQMMERLYQGAAAEPLPIPRMPVTPGDPGLVPGASAQQRLDAARATLAQLEQRLTPEHPDVRRQRRMIAELEPLAAKEASVPPDSRQSGPSTTPEEVARRTRLREMKAEIESLERQIQFRQGEETRLRAQIAEFQGRVEAVPGVESQLFELSRDYDTLSEQYKDLLAKSESSRVAENLEKRQISEQFRILDKPRLPTSPTSPARLQITAVGFFLGVAMASALVAWREFRDSTFHRPDDIVTTIALPVLASAPYLPTRGQLALERRRQVLWTAAGSAATIAAGVLFVHLRLWNYIV